MTATTRPARAEMRQQALSRATSGQTMSNYPAIIGGFLERGIPEDQILPRENVFTFQAWKALGRHVRKGEHGVHVLTYVHGTRTDRQTGEESAYSYPKGTTVFHVSQTDPDVPAQEVRS